NASRPMCGRCPTARVAIASRDDVEPLSSLARTFTVTVISSIELARPTAFAANCGGSSPPEIGTRWDLERAMMESPGTGNEPRADGFRLRRWTSRHSECPYGGDHYTKKIPEKLFDKRSPV